MPDSARSYVGHRILQAMRNAVLYSEAIFQKARAAKPAGDISILEFGAGDGMFLEKFRDAGVTVDCVEPDPELASRLTRRSGRVHADIGDIGDASYDFVYTINVLEHVSDLDKTYAELFRVLAPAGRLFVFVPAFEILWTSLDDEVGHVRRFHRGALAGALEKRGFIVERIEFFDSMGFLAALAVRLLEKFNLFSYTRGTVGFYDRCLFPISRSLDRVLNGVFGKNLIAVARKPG